MNNNNLVQSNFNIISKLYDNTYYNEQNIDNENIKRLINQETNIRKNFSVLELGCGTGYWLEYLANLGVNKIVGIDFSHGMLEKAETRCKCYNNIILLKRKLPEELYLNERYNLILCSFFISFLEEEKIYELFTKIKGIMLQEGKVIIIDNQIPKKDILLGTENLVLELNETWGSHHLKCKYNLFTPHAIQNIGNKVGFKIKYVSYVSDDIYFTVMELDND